MFKRIVMVAVLGLAGVCVASETANAGIFYRPIAPVRRVAARTVLPPYPVVRRVVPAPVVYRPYVAPVYRPVYYSAPYVPYVYGGGVSVYFGY
jgi:hypothetical protein